MCPYGGNRTCAWNGWRGPGTEPRGKSPKGYGYYTKQKKDILYIIVSKQEITRLRKIILEVDSKAFITVQDVRNVFGEGFLGIADD